MSEIERRNFPRNMLEIEEQFSTEQDCRNYLEGLRWPDGFECPGCYSKEAWKTQRGTFFCQKCQRQTSVTAGTIFEGTRKPLRIWFRAVWLVVGEKNGISALGLQRELGLSRYSTAWMMLQKVRRAMVRPGREQLIGEVEVDETMVGGKQSGKRGRGAEGKELVLIASEIDGKKTGRIRMEWIANAEAKTLKGFIKKHIAQGSTIITDGWGGYVGLTKLGYKHKVVNGESVGKDEILPRVHRVASLLKRWLLGTHQGGVNIKAGLNVYLDEFTFRFNRRTSHSRGMLFYRLLQQAVHVGHTTQKEIMETEHPSTTCSSG